MKLNHCQFTLAFDFSIVCIKIYNENSIYHIMANVYIVLQKQNGNTADGQ